MGKGDPGWNLLEGSGERQSDKFVQFPREFAETPMVVVSLAGLDVGNDANTRLIVSDKSVTKTGFEVDFRTWGDTHVYSVNVIWVAYIY